MSIYKSVFVFQTNSEIRPCFGVIADYDILAFKKIKTYMRIKEAIACDILLYKKKLL